MSLLKQVSIVLGFIFLILFVLNNKLILRKKCFGIEEGECPTKRKEFIREKAFNLLKATNLLKYKSLTIYSFSFFIFFCFICFMFKS